MKLTELKGIGQKTEEAFARIGVNTVEDLLEFYPRDFEVFYPPIMAAEIGYKTFVSVKGIFTQPLVNRKVGKLNITSGVLKDEAGGSIKVTWFNAPFMKDAVKCGAFYVLRGRISRKKGHTVLDQPKVFTEEEYNEKLYKLQPIYALTKGLSNNQIIKAVNQAFSSRAYGNAINYDCVPENVRREANLCSKAEMIQGMHFPKSKVELEKAGARAAFEEIFLFILAMKENGAGVKGDSEFVIREDERTAAFLKGLPFELTKAQKTVIAEINEDLTSGKVMNRLVQGDVGSGKTMVALSACMNTAFAGYQSAFMAPTEVLAAQHFETITGLFKKYGVDLHVGLLTGSMTALEKKAVYQSLESGKIDILVGTHALFQEKVNYKKLALIITDEQHRFGIKQREALANKGSAPHMMVMSATPIPRTLALIVYGNMDVSVIDTVPARRKPIKNAIIDDSYKDNAYRLIEREVKAGHQAYIICPLVEYSEGVEAQNVQDYTEMLVDILDPSIRIGMLHGQMKNAAKNEIMAKFASGQIDVLVSTTVVEVGVDVPNSTVMMIEDANRFGLAALHQLRGRVGRGDAQSYCMFVCNNGSKEAAKRLEILKLSNNGFEIAARDLELRGPGEFLGVRQSGDLAFKNFDLYRDASLATIARQAADGIADGRIEITEGEKFVIDRYLEKQSGSLIL